MQVNAWLNIGVFSVFGWTIIHSLWQCLGLLILVKIILGMIDVRRSAVRYAVALGALILVVGWILGTFIWEWRMRMGAMAQAAGNAGFGPHAAVPAALKLPDEAPMFSLLPWLARLCPYLTMGWLAGMIFFMGRLVYQGFLLGRLRRDAGMPDAGAEQLLEKLRVQLGLSVPVRLLITERVTEPMTFGFLRAVVVMPLHYFGQVPADQLEMILAHELSHIRRRDYLVNLVQSVFDALLFFNPFFRMISSMVREEREYCCDDLAAGVGGGERMMAVALTNLKLMIHRLPLALGVAPGRRSFYRRVSRLIDAPEGPVVSMRGALLGFLGAFAAVAILTQCSRGVIAQDSLPGDGDRLVQMFTDNQAGYKEQVYGYSKNGRNHDLFLVRTIDAKRPVYAYLDGVLLSPAELDRVMKSVKASIQMVKIIAVGGAKEGRMKIDSASVGVLATGQVKQQVDLAMKNYQEDVRRIPIDVKLHEVLTRIITNREYTPEDRSELNGLVRQRMEL